jgi:serine/threonine protein kinase
MVKVGDDDQLSTIGNKKITPHFQIELITFSIALQDKKLGRVPREVYILKHLPKHSCAIRFLHYEKTSPSSYVIVMDRPCRSKNLHRLRGERFFPFTEQKAKKIVKDLGSLLLKMQERRIIHGDIKPRNIIYDLDQGTCKLVDFGLARFHETGKFVYQFEGGYRMQRF